MAKKRQPDFAKTQLKPGRTLTRRKNAAPTFKSKKLEIQGKKSSSKKSASNIPDCLNAILKNGGSIRISALERLGIFIQNKESLSPFLGEVLEVVVAKLLLETGGSLRKYVLEIIKSIFKHTEDESFKIKLSSYSTLFITVLSASMAHPNSEVRRSSLDVLEIILTNHPNLICDSFTVLQNFLKLITDSPRKFSHLQYSKSRSPVAVISPNTDNSTEYRVFVLEIMRRFLREMLKNFEKEAVTEENCDEQEVYWNCEGPLHLQLYAGSGLKPLDIEKGILKNNSSSQERIFNNLLIEPSFVNRVLHSISTTFKEEVAGQNKGDDKELPLSTIKNLNALLQVVCQLTELASHIPFDEVDSEISGLLHLAIYEKKLFPFKARGALSAKVQHTELAELNLAVCFLHCKFLLKTDVETEKYTDPIINYIPKMFVMRFEDKYQLIPMLVKILKRYYSLSNLQKVQDFVKESLLFLSNLLKGADHHPNRSGLISLFTMLSLHPAYNFLSETEAMENWFNWLLAQLIDTPKTDKINRNLLRIIKIIANRKYKNFLQAVDRTTDNKFKSLLQYDDDDVRDTVIFLIYNMDDIRISLLEEISNIILSDVYFPFRYAARLIRLLTCRFTDKLSGNCSNTEISSFKRKRADFVQFLLNLAIDSINLTNEKCYDYEANEYTKSLENLKDVTPYNIFPSVQWKEHSQLFEVCQKSLSLLPPKLVNNIAIMMFNEILETAQNLPMHTAIAILKLHNPEMKNGHYRYQIDDLVFSCLLTISVLTHMTTEEEWLENNVTIPIESMELSRRLAFETVQRQINSMDEVDGITLFYLLRILKFYLDQGLILPKDGGIGLDILEAFKEKCTDKLCKHQPLFTSLYNVFYFYV